MMSSIYVIAAWLGKMTKNIIVSVHIPKTAGTTMSHIFDRLTDNRVFYDYPDFEGYDRDEAFSPAEIAFINRRFDILHGHFFARKYFDVFPQSQFIATVRHPVYRVISQYLHSLNESTKESWCHEDLASGRMDVVDYAAVDGVGNAQSMYLAGRRPEDYDLLLIAEHLINSLILFNHYIRPIDTERSFGSPPRLPTINTYQERPRQVTITEKQMSAIYDRSPEDNELYRQALDLFFQKRLAMAA